MEDDLVSLAIEEVGRGQLAYCKFLSANDTGQTGAHQSGIYIEKRASAILFDEPGVKGDNKDQRVRIRWQYGLTTDSRFIYYGAGTRNEYRITRFGPDFPFLRPEHTGDLFVLIKRGREDYLAFVLQTEEDIDAFLDAFAMGPTDTGNIIRLDEVRLDDQYERAFSSFISTLPVDFPASFAMSRAARMIHSDVAGRRPQTRTPDEQLIAWIDIEFRLFRKIEFSRYGDMINRGFQSVEDFIEVANSVLNRRKSRAGKSLEHHLAAMFDANALVYEAQAVTEGNKRPDFLFPGRSAYRDPDFPTNRLTMLAAKTTCKDRWRQILNEANRIPGKHLLTLQQGISSQQLQEMEDEGVTLIVPKPYISTYPKEWREKIWTVETFLAFVKARSGE